MKVTESVRLFLENRKSASNADLIDRAMLYWPNLEFQVNVSAGNGELVADKRTTWSDGITSWWNIRCPKNASTDPSWDDYEMRWPLDEHAEGIGFTGWQFKDRKSLWVAFDIDDLTSHAAGVGISEVGLERVKEAASDLPYIETRRSTGGGGLHLYCHLDNIPTQNHTEHAALARCILGMMSSDCNFDFASHIDCCGGIMWAYHKKMSAENRGLEIIKPSTKILTTAELPTNWKDHVEVITKQRTKVRINEITDENQDPFEALASSRKIVPLDDSHKAQIDELQSSGFTTLWVPDHHLLQTHTKALEELMSVKELKLIGYFKTISQGNHPEMPNCFLFPLLDGAWKVYRFSPGINEAETWTQDGDGWTTCYFNRRPNLKSACLACGGIEDPDGGFAFTKTDDAVRAAKLLGQALKIDSELENRQIHLKTHKDGRLVVQIEKKKDDKPTEGWLDKKKKWVKLFETKTEVEEETSSSEYDNLIRAVITPANKFAYWCLHDGSKWPEQPSQNIKMVLQKYGNSKTEAEEIMGEAISKEWDLVSLPFQAEYPGGRQWNREAAQFRYKAADLEDEPQHPHWDAIYEHVGQELTPALKELQWAIDAGIKTGGDYLRAWSACVFRYPFEQLPYLFLHGDEESGKSTFWESFEVLITKGVVQADKALTSQSDFNGELAGAIICVVDEKDISKHPGAAAKIRAAVTSRTLSIRQMRMDAYQIPNTSHWIQCGNHVKNCPIPTGDTRVTVCRVPMPPTDIPKLFLFEKLREEAPQFMYTLMTLALPPVIKRLRLPVVTTVSKIQSQDANRDALEKFVATNCIQSKEGRLMMKEFYDRFLESLPPEDRVLWPRARVISEFPSQYPFVEGHANAKYFSGLVLA